MPTIKGTSFTSSTNLDKVEVRSCAVPGVGSAALHALREKNFFKDTPCVFFFCNLAQDNEKILSGRLCVLGEIPFISVTASRFFPSIKQNYIIKIKDLKLPKFDFDEDLVSQTIGFEALSLTIELEGVEMEWEDYMNDGGGEFSIMGHVNPTSATYCKLQIGLIPITGENLHALECSPAEIPSMLILTQVIPINPPTHTPWGLSFLVMIILGDPLRAVGEVNQQELREVIHSIMRGAIQNTFCKHRKSLDKKLEACVRGEAPKPRKTNAWPELAIPETDSSAGTKIQKYTYIYQKSGSHGF